MTPQDEDITQAEMRRWLTRLEGQVVAGFEHVDQRLDRVTEQVRTAGYVPLVLYQSERDALKDEVGRLDKRVDNIRTVVLAVIGLTLTATGIMISLVKAVA